MNEREAVVVRIKSPEDIAGRYAKRCLIAYLEGKKNLNWIVGVIGSSGVSGNSLARIFEELRDYGDPNRYSDARAACERLEWI